MLSIGTLIAFLLFGRDVELDNHFLATKLGGRWTGVRISVYINDTSLRHLVSAHCTICSRTFVCYDSVAYHSNMLETDFFRRPAGAKIIG